MGTFTHSGQGPAARRRVALCVSMCACVLTAGCAGNDAAKNLFADANGNAQLETNSVAQPTSAEGESEQQALQRAVAYWANEYRNDPKKPENALNYATNLKAVGDKKSALGVLARAFQMDPKNPDLASAYGRLALDMGDVKLAEKVLPYAEVEGKPDWRVISAKGTLYAKRGDHKQAQAYFLRALQLAPDQPTVLNNLALAYALDGKPQEAERLLRLAMTSNSGNKRLRQNLALVLGLQGKFDEAKALAATDLSSETVKQNESYLRQIVRAPEKSAGEGSGAARDQVSGGQQVVVKQSSPGDVTGSVGKPVQLQPQRKAVARAPAPVAVPQKSAGVPQVVRSPLPLPKKTGAVEDEGVTRPASGKKAEAPSPAAKRSPQGVAKARPAFGAEKQAAGRALPATMRSGTYDDGLSGWVFDVDEKPTIVAPKT